MGELEFHRASALLSPSLPPTGRVRRASVAAAFREAHGTLVLGRRWPTSTPGARIWYVPSLICFVRVLLQCLFSSLMTATSRWQHRELLVPVAALLFTAGLRSPEMAESLKLKGYQEVMDTTVMPWTHRQQLLQWHG
ncbi:unnamed protein product [Urochloa humidicola]